MPIALCQQHAVTGTHDHNRAWKSARLNAVGNYLADLGGSTDLKACDNCGYQGHSGNHYSTVVNVDTKGVS